MEVLQLIPLLTVVVGIVALYFTIRHFKIVRTVSYIERLNSPAMVPIRVAVEKFLTTSKSPEEKLQQLKEDQELSAQVTMVYNLFTELAIAYRYRTINRRMLLSTWSHLIIWHWEHFQFMLLDRRRQGKNLGYNFELLYEEFMLHEQRSRMLAREKLAVDRLRAKRLRQKRPTTASATVTPPPPASGTISPEPKR